MPRAQRQQQDPDDTQPGGEENEQEQKRGRGGRKSANGGTEPVRLESLRTREKDLIELFTVQQAAKTAYDEAVNATAEASGLNSASVAKYIKARAGDQERFDEQKRKIVQLALVFEEGPEK